MALTYIQSLKVSLYVYEPILLLFLVVLGAEVLSNWSANNLVF